MDPVRRAIRAARARLFRQAWLTAAGGAALWTIGVLIVLLAADRALALRLPVGWIALGLVAAAVVAAPALAARRRPTDGDVAAMLDQRLGLKDRLATALYAESLGDDPLAAQVVAEARHAAERAPVAQATPVRLTRRWAFVPALLLLLALAWWLLPDDLDLLGMQAKRDAAAKQLAEQRAAERELEQARQMMRRAAQREGGDAQDGDELPQLAQLTNKDLSTPEGRKQAAAELAEAADQLAEQAEQQQKQADEQDNMLSRLQPQKFGPANRFASDLRRGDLDAAQQSLQDVADSIDGMSEKQKQELAEQLRDMAEQLDREAQRQGEKSQQAEQKLRDQLKQEGLADQQVKELAEKQFDRKAVEEALKQQGADEQQARDAAAAANERKQAQQAAEESQQAADKLSDALSRMADAAAAPSQQTQGSQKTQETQQSGNQSSPSQQAQQNQQQQGQSSGQSQSQQQQEQASGQQQSSQQAVSGQPGSQQQQGGQQQSSQQSSGSQPGSGFQQAAQSAQQQLQRMSQTGEQARDLRQSQQQVRQAMQRMAGASPSGASQGEGQGRGDAPSRTASRDFRATASESVNDMSAERRRNAGKVIGTWDDRGEVPKGEAKVAFDQAAAAAMTEVEQSVNEDRVPKRYHEALREYFHQGADE